MFDRRLIENFDWGLLLLILSISCVGLVILYSAVTAGTPDATHVLFKSRSSGWAVGPGSC